MEKNNKKKSEQLGMSFGKANQILRKRIMFSLIQRLGLDICYRCGHKIELIADLSIEHKQPWLDSEDPKKLFFNIDNIAFSHLKCNSSCKRFNMSDKGKQIISDLHRGENNCCSKITLKIANEIRTKYNSGKYSLRKLAKEYPINKTNILKIVNNERWKQV